GLVQFDPRFEVAVEAARALVKLDEAKACVPFLADALKRRGGPEDRLACIQILKQIGPPAAAAVPGLANALEEAKLRDEAGAALARMGRPALGALQKKMVASYDARTRLACVTAVG